MQFLVSSSFLENKEDNNNNSASWLAKNTSCMSAKTYREYLIQSSQQIYEANAVILGDANWALGVVTIVYNRCYGAYC